MTDKRRRPAVAVLGLVAVLGCGSADSPTAPAPVVDPVPEVAACEVFELESLGYFESGAGAGAGLFRWNAFFRNGCSTSYNVNVRAILVDAARGEIVDSDQLSIALAALAEGAACGATGSDDSCWLTPQQAGVHNLRYVWRACDARDSSECWPDWPEAVD